MTNPVNLSNASSEASQLNQELRALLALVFGRQVQEVPADAALGAYTPWDSLGHIEVMMAVEAKFGVSVPSNRLAELVSLELIAEFLREHGHR